MILERLTVLCDPVEAEERLAAGDPVPSALMRSAIPIACSGLSIRCSFAKITSFPFRSSESGQYQQERRQRPVTKSTIFAPW